MKSTLVLLSGGLDSAVTAKHYLNQNYRVEGLFVSYGQPWMHELNYAVNVARYLDIPLHIETAIFPIPKDGYFIPMRNMHLLTFAVAEAVSLSLKTVAIGANKCEYLDQTPEFIDRFNFTMEYCLRDPIWVLSPFCSWPKERIFKYAQRLKFPINLTCPCNDEPPCGKCLSCRLRGKYKV